MQKKWSLYGKLFNPEQQLSILLGSKCHSNEKIYLFSSGPSLASLGVEVEAKFSMIPCHYILKKSYSEQIKLPSGS